MPHIRIISPPKPPPPPRKVQVLQLIWYQISIFFNICNGPALLNYFFEPSTQISANLGKLKSPNCQVSIQFCSYTNYLFHSFFFVSVLYPSWRWPDLTFYLITLTKLAEGLVPPGGGSGGGGSGESEGRLLDVLCQKLADRALLLKDFMKEVK